MEEHEDGWDVAWERFRHAARIPVMVLFAFGCFALLLFLWVSFGGPVPLQANGYHLTVDFPEATTLAQHADVRMSGVKIGNVQSESLERGTDREKVVLSIDPKYVPLPKDTHAILRQKTLLGETFVELSPGRPGSGRLKDGARLPNAQVEPTVELDEILRIFDPKTKTAFRDWLAESARQISGNAPQDLNDALGNLAGFAQDGATLLQVLNDQSTAVRDLVRNTGVVFKALNERSGQLRQLILNSHATFSATSAEQNALAQVFQIFPTFLDESRLTAARLEQFSINTDPLARELKPVATDLGPAVRDLGNLAPDLKTFFVKLKPVIRAAPRDLPQGARFLRGAAPLFDALHPFLTQLNPVLSYLNFTQNIVAHFFVDGGPAFRTRIANAPDSHVLPQIGITNDKSLSLQTTRPVWDRGNTYIQPNTIDRSIALGIYESLDCSNDKSPRRDPDPSLGVPPCFVMPPSAYSGTQFPHLDPGKVYLKPIPGVNQPAGSPDNAQTHP